MDVGARMAMPYPAPREEERNLLLMLAVELRYHQYTPAFFFFTIDIFYCGGALVASCDRYAPCLACTCDTLPRSAERIEIFLTHTLRVNSRSSLYELAM